MNASRRSRSLPRSRWARTPERKPAERIRRGRHGAPWLLVALFCLGYCGLSRADGGATPASQRPSSRPASAPAPATPAPPPADAEDDGADEPVVLAVVGGRIYTSAGCFLEGATLLCEDGRIAAIGPEVEIPEGAEVLDVEGRRIYPGLVAINTRGIVGSRDSTDVFSLYLTLGLAGGLTTVVNGNTALKLTRGTLENHLLESKIFESLRYSTRNPRGRKSLRDAFERVREYLRDLQAYEIAKARDPKAKKPDDKWIRGDFAKAKRLLDGSAVALVDANTTHEIIELARLAQQYGFRIVVRGAREGYLVASELARAGAAAIVTPRVRRDRDERLVRPNGSSIENARILYEHGVPLVISPTGYDTFISLGGLAGRDIQHLRMEAAFAVRGGLPERAAIDAITIEAARQLGIDHRVGSIEVGKDADLVITDGDLLHYMSLVRWTLVDGRIVYDKEKESLFRHIRPGDDADAPPPPDNWPRRLGEDW